MRLSFSTRGWGDVPWDELVETASDMGFAGIEAYDVLGNEKFCGKGGPFDPYNLRATTRNLRGRGLQMPVLDTPIDISVPGEAAGDVKRLVDVASELGVEYVCVKGQHGSEDAVREALDELLPYAEERGVVLLMETSGIYGDTARLTELMDGYASDYLAALWDVHHPYRDCGEDPSTTIKNLGAYVKHVHMRDSDDDGSYNLVGEGTMPIADVVRALASIDYDGFVSLEWKPEWMSDLTDMDIILPHFVNYMDRFEDTRGRRKPLYLNHDGTGEYIWKKYDLIDHTFPQVLD